MIWALISLSLLILFHELGHYLVARFNRVNVKEFSVGFGKPGFCRQIGITKWCIRPIPLGGYVKMEEEGEKGFNQLHPIRKIAILLGGPIANFLIGYLIIYGVVVSTGIGYFKPIVGEVIPNSPAFQKLQPGDLILKVDSIPITRWSQLSPTINRQGKIHTPIVLEVERKGQLLQIPVKPEKLKGKNLFGEEVEQYIIGVKVASTGYTHQSVGMVEGVGIAGKKFWEFSKLIYTGVKKLITGAVSWKGVSGPIGIMETSSQMLEYGIVPFLMLTALISINLGLLNLLPIPVLDGGGIILQFYPLITNRPINPKIENFLIAIGIGILIFFLGVGVYNDLTNLTGGNK